MRICVTRTGAEPELPHRREEPAKSIARERKTKRAQWLEFTLKRGRYQLGLHSFDTTHEPLCTALRGSGRLPLRLSFVERRAPAPLLTTTRRVPRTHGTRLAGTSTAVPRPSCKLEAGHHRGSWH